MVKGTETYEKFSAAYIFLLPQLPYSPEFKKSGDCAWQSFGDAMKHFAAEKWVELVRNVAPAEERRSLENHLSECNSCAGLVGFYRQIASRAAGEALYQPPDGAVRAAKAQFAAAPFANAKAGILELLYDSLLEPLTAGARASVASARQLLYRIGPVYLDLRVDSEPNSERASLVGQMLDRSNPEHPITGTAVVLLAGQKKIASTSSNGNGEFHLEFAMRSNLRLSVAVDPLHPVYLPITSVQQRPASRSRGN
jgi:hypothetical protein